MGPTRTRSHVVSGLCLDAGALIAVERGDRRVLRLLELARSAGQAVDVPTGVVAQVWRGGERQVPLARFLRTAGVTFVDLDLATARAIGQLCAITGGTDVVDGHVALHALRSERTVVTSDPDDIADFAPAVPLVHV